jgi:hypothetical protein
MKKEKPTQIETDEWLFKGCFIQKNSHPKLIGNYEVFKNDKNQNHVDRCYSFAEAKQLCINNECFDDYLKF